jgi:dihydrofolate synthase / folylpolyglutamate synthase
MKYIQIKIRTMFPPQDDLYSILDKYLPKLKEGDVVLIASKVLAIHQGRCLLVRSKREKDRLVKAEADRYLPTKIMGEFYLTIKDSTLIASAGIDQSNANGYNILWPTKINALSKEICLYLRKKHNIGKLAVIVTDSHSLPLRKGMLGVSVGYFGLEPLRSYKRERDIFGRKLKYTAINVVDVLATGAVFLMGEGNEKVPIVVARDVPKLVFVNRQTYRKLLIPERDDIYYPMLKAFKKAKKA